MSQIQIDFISFHSWIDTIRLIKFKFGDSRWEDASNWSGMSRMTLFESTFQSESVRWMVVWNKIDNNKEKQRLFFVIDILPF